MNGAYASGGVLLGIRRTALCLAMWATLLPVAALAASLNLPAPSMWKLDPAASTGGGSKPSPGNTITVNAYSKSSMNVAVHYVLSDGKAMDVTFNGAPDGRPHRYSGGNGSFRDDGVYTFEQPDGTHEYGTLTLSADGKTLTNTYTVKPRSGASTQVVCVYMRVR